MSDHVYTLHRISPLKEDNLSTKDKPAGPLIRGSTEYLFHIHHNVKWLSLCGILLYLTFFFHSFHYMGLALIQYCCGVPFQLVPIPVGPQTINRIKMLMEPSCGIANLPSIWPFCKLLMKQCRNANIMKGLSFLPSF